MMPLTTINDYDSCCKEVLTMEHKVEGLQSVPKENCARRIMNDNQSLINESVRTEDKTDQQSENTGGNMDDTGPRYDSGDIVEQVTEVKTREVITEVVISMQDDELIGYATSPAMVGSMAAITKDIPMDTCDQSVPSYGRHMASGDSRIPESTGAATLKSKSGSENVAELSWKCDDAAENMIAHSHLVEECEQLNEHESSTRNIEYRLTRTEKVTDFIINMPEDFEESDDHDTLEISASTSDCSHRVSNSLIVHEALIESDTLRRGEQCRDTESPSETLLDSSRESEEGDILQKDEKVSTRSDSDKGLQRKNLVDECKETDTDIAFNREEPKSTCLNSDAGLLGETLAHGCSECDEDDECKRDEPTSTARELLPVDRRESDQDNSYKRDEQKSTDLTRDTDIPSQILTEKRSEGDDVDTFNSDEPKSTYLSICLDVDIQFKSRVEDCEQLYQGNNNSEDDSKLSSLTVSKNTDMSSEKPKNECDIPITKEIKYVTTAKTFKEVDILIKSDDGKNEELTEDSKGILCKKVTGGRKHGAVSSIINKYNTLLHSAVPGGEKEKYKPKAIKLTASKDVNSCTSCAKQEPDMTILNQSNGDVAVDEVKMKCDNVEDVRESRLRGKSKTESITDCNHTMSGTNANDVGERIAKTIESQREMCECYDTNENCVDSTAMSGYKETQELGAISQMQAVDKTECLPLVEVNLQDNKIPHQSSKSVVDETCETRVVESPSEFNSILLGSTFDSLDADDEFSSQEDYKIITPKSSNSEHDDGNFYQKGGINVGYIETHLNFNQVEIKNVLDELPNEIEIKNECYKLHNTEDNNVSITPDYTSVEHSIHISNDAISMAVNRHEINDSNDFIGTRSHAVSQECLQNIELPVKECTTTDLTHALYEVSQECLQNIELPVKECTTTDLTHAVSQERLQNIEVPVKECTITDFAQELLDIEDTELIYLDAESVDFNEQSESSWGQVVSCCNSGDQSGSEMQDCIQLYPNEDMKSLESSVYDDVASGSNLEFSIVVNNSDPPNLKYVSSYTSDGSCSNFFSEEGDHKQSDNQDGYASALDLAEDLDVRSSCECLEPLELGNGCCKSGEEVTQCDVKVSISKEHIDTNTYILYPQEDENVLGCNETETCLKNAVALYTNMDQLDTNTNDLTEKEKNTDFIPESCTDKCINKIHSGKQECMPPTLHTSSKQEIGKEPNNLVPYHEYIVESTTYEEPLMHKGSDNVQSEIDCMANRVEEINETCSKYTVEQIVPSQDVLEKEDHPHNENGKEGKCDNQTIDEDATKMNISGSVLDDVESKALPNLTTVCDSDNACSEDLKDIEVDIVNDSESVHKDSTHVANKGNNANEVIPEVFYSDEEDSTHVANKGNNANEVIPEVFSRDEEDSTHVANNGNNANEVIPEVFSRDEDDSTHVANIGNNANEVIPEVFSSDEEDETKDACCKEYQVVWKRMKKLKKAMAKLNEQVCREKSYLQQETDLYRNMPQCNLTLFEHKLAEVQRERWLESQRVKITREEYTRRLKEADQMCVDEIHQMNAAEEKLRHLARITDVWTRTNVVLPYYDLPSLDLTPREDDPPEVTQKKVDELETQVVDLIGQSDVYMTSWLLNEAEKMKANYPVARNTKLNIQNLNDLSVDQMLLPPHLLEKLEEMRDLVKAHSLTTEFTQNAKGTNFPDKLQINLTECRDLRLDHSTQLPDSELPPMLNHQPPERIDITL